MKKMTTALALTALMLCSVMNKVLHADELLPRDDFYLADEEQQAWANERHGRTGVLEISGALLSSPCTLITNEVAVPLQSTPQGGVSRYPLQLALTGCGEGDALTSEQAPAARSSVLVVYSALLSGVDGGILHPQQRMLGTARAVLPGGATQITWFLTDEQQSALMGKAREHAADNAPYSTPATGALLRLRMDYE